jgi:hypothetical protein
MQPFWQYVLFVDDQGKPSAGTIILIGFYAWISLGLIATLWLKHRHEKLGRKIQWTLVILLPPIGWILYLGLFKPPGVTDTPGIARGSMIGDGGGYAGGGHG